MFLHQKSATLFSYAFKQILFLLCIKGNNYQDTDFVSLLFFGHFSLLLKYKAVYIHTQLPVYIELHSLDRE